MARDNIIEYAKNKWLEGEITIAGHDLQKISKSIDQQHDVEDVTVPSFEVSAIIDGKLQAKESDIQTYAGNSTILRGQLFKLAKTLGVLQFHLLLLLCSHIFVVRLSTQGFIRLCKAP